jgi:hypothetical protein
MDLFWRTSMMNLTDLRLAISQRPFAALLTPSSFNIYTTSYINDTFPSIINCIYIKDPPTKLFDSSSYNCVL